MKNLSSKIIFSSIEAGCDEVGRGCIAGPVVAAAVILPDDFEHEWLDDSKKISFKKRTFLAEYIKKQALDFAIAQVSNEWIDECNILKASIFAMHLALDKLKIRPEHIAVDGNRFTPYQNIPHQCVIKGDSKLMNIAAASIIAKDFRDRLMIDFHRKYPHYQWDKNMGYPTITHKKAVLAHGISPLHRRTFKMSL